MLILASKSPRRKELLTDAGLKFSVVPSEIDESAFYRTSPVDLVVALAEAKARAVAADYPNDWIIGADTVVVIADEILGKPDSVDTARCMLEKLNGKRHSVYTGFCICCQTLKSHFVDVVKTDVFFKRFNLREIDWYIQTNEPFDKAGAYAIQGLGAFLVSHIHGSYTNVVGLPVCELLDHLFKAGIIEPDTGKNQWAMG